MLLSEDGAFHVALMDKTLEGVEEHVVQDPSEHATPHDTGCGKFNEMETSIAWIVGSSQLAAGVALGLLGRALGSQESPPNCMES